VINSDTIKDFQNAIRQKIGAEVSFEEAKEILLGLVDYFDLLYEISHRD
jgi:hypothetical protein